MNKYKNFFLYINIFVDYWRERERRNMNREIKFLWINDINNIIVGR